MAPAGVDAERRSNPVDFLADLSAIGGGGDPFARYRW
jgi:hypothetical protein